MYVSVAPFSEPGMLCLLACHLLSRTPDPTHSLSASVVVFRDSKVGDSSKDTISHNRAGAPLLCYPNDQPGSLIALVRSLGQAKALITHKELSLPLLNELPRVQSSRKTVCRRRNLYALGPGKSPIRIPLGRIVEAPCCTSAQIVTHRTVVATSLLSARPPAPTNATGPKRPLPPSTRPRIRENGGRGSCLRGRRPRPRRRASLRMGERT